MTPGPLAYRKHHYLAPNRLTVAEKEFENLICLGLAWPESHVVAKINDEWRLCEDCHGFNAQTFLDCYPICHVEDL